MKYDLNCYNCGRKTYRVTDGIHSVHICWQCGDFEIYPPRYDELEQMLLFNPGLLYQLIENGHFMPSE